MVHEENFNAGVYDYVPDPRKQYQVRNDIGKSARDAFLELVFDPDPDVGSDAVERSRNYDAMVHLFNAHDFMHLLRVGFIDETCAVLLDMRRRKLGDEAARAAIMLKATLLFTAYRYQAEYVNLASVLSLLGAAGLRFDDGSTNFKNVMRLLEEKGADCSYGEFVWSYDRLRMKGLPSPAAVYSLVDALDFADDEKQIAMLAGERIAAALQDSRELLLLKCELEEIIDRANR